MSKCTPGPWTVESNKQDVCFVADSDMVVIASISDDTGKMRENAHIIAAAPEMLEVLEIIKHEIIELKNPFNIGHAILVNKAIEKARNES